MRIFDFFRGKRKREDAQRSSQYRFESDRTIIWDKGDSVTVMSGSEFDKHVTKLRQVFETAIRDHITKVCSITKNREAISNLRTITDNLNMVMSIVWEKIPQCLSDGKGHSKAFQLESGGPFINVSCWPCDLNELRDSYKHQIGDYGSQIPRYVTKAQEFGASCFIHLFICYVKEREKVAVTLCYADTKFKTLLTPNELIDLSSLR